MAAAGWRQQHSSSSHRSESGAATERNAKQSKANRRDETHEAPRSTLRAVVLCFCYGLSDPSIRSPEIFRDSSPFKLHIYMFLPPATNVFTSAVPICTCKRKNDTWLFPFPLWSSTRVLLHTGGLAGPNVLLTLPRRRACGSCSQSQVERIASQSCGFLVEIFLQGTKPAYQSSTWHARHFFVCTAVPCALSWTRQGKDRVGNVFIRYLYVHRCSTVCAVSLSHAGGRQGRAVPTNVSAPRTHCHVANVRACVRGRETVGASQTHERTAAIINALFLGSTTVAASRFSSFRPQRNVRHGMLIALS